MLYRPEYTRHPRLHAGTPSGEHRVCEYFSGLDGGTFQTNNARFLLCYKNPRIE
jgi:hypothetical protein